jgi:hypothetical protein
MGFLQNTIWNNVFDYAYPITFIGALFYTFIHMFDIEPLSIISNGKFLFVLNLFIGLCALLSFAAWFHTDLSSINNVTSLIDLNANQTVSEVQTTN